jgi:hypothetical protein
LALLYDFAGGRRKTFTEVLYQLGSLPDLQDRMHDAWLPESARQQARQIIKRIQVQLHQRQEYGWEYEPA